MLDLCVCTRCPPIGDDVYVTDNGDWENTRLMLQVMAEFPGGGGGVTFVNLIFNHYYSSVLSNLDHARIKETNSVRFTLW